MKKFVYTVKFARLFGINVMYSAKNGYKLSNSTFQSGGFQTILVHTKHGVRCRVSVL